jgi:hypothetical protein
MSVTYPPYIFGMHDRGAEHLMLQKNKLGWVLVTEAVGTNPQDQSGTSYTDLSSKGFGVISRLNNGYGTAGTIPYSHQYDDFARRCGNFCQASPGCHIWIIGNEMNLAWERPGGPNGQVITPQLYATCFRKCRDEIRRRPGHGNDQVVMGAIAPWNTQTTYPGNLRGDWVQYQTDVLTLLGQDVDGISIHTYSHGQDPGLVTSDTKMNTPFQNYHWHFRAYRDFMAAIPASLRDRPVYITETDQNDAWRDANSGWVRNAYREIDDWNRNLANQPIQALILFRWIIGNPNDPQQVGWAIENKPGVQADLRDAMNNEYRVVLPSGKPEYRAVWLNVTAPTVIQPGATASFNVTVRNDGRRSWPQTGTEIVRLGHRWIDASGAATEGTRHALPQAVSPGQTVTLTGVTVRAPAKPGYYTLELDLVQGASTWFASKGSPVWRARNLRVGPIYRAAWPSVAAPSEANVGETVTFPVRVRNNGALTWPPTGSNPVNLTYKWLDLNHNVLVADGLRTPIGRQVQPLEEITLQAAVQFPAQAGSYILQFDMVHEFITWFQWRGSPVHEVQVSAKAALPDYAAEWLDYVGPEHLVVGQAGNGFLELRNVGSQPWPRSGSGAVALGYRWLDGQGVEVPVAGAQLRTLPREVAPGEVVFLGDCEFLAPVTPGAYRLVWDLRQDGAWLSSRGVAILERPVQIAAPDYRVEWEIEGAWPAWLPPAELQQTSLRLHNAGTRPWPAGGPYPVHLAYHWFASTAKIAEPWDTFRISLPRDVPPGDTVFLPDIPFKTPAVLGDYILRWDLVEEGQAWFFRQGGAPLELPVQITDRLLSIPWTAQASHNSGDAALAFDRNPDTFWNSGANQQPGMWFQVNLGQLLTLDRVRVFSPGRGFPGGYRLWLSADSQDWRLAAEKEQNWTDLDIAFSPCPARYLRIELVAKPDWPATWMISEIAVGATTAWVGAEASHYTDDAWKALDGRLDTAWTTRAVKQRPGMWFKLDMGSLRRIERLTLEHPKDQLPRGYIVQVSEAGDVWHEVYRADDNWGRLDARFAPVAARYVRVETTQSSHYLTWGIRTCAVWRSLPIWLRGRQA